MDAPFPPQNLVPTLPKGLFFRVVKKHLYHSTRYYVQLRRKKLIGSSVLETSEIYTNYYGEFSEGGILRSMQEIKDRHEAHAKMKAKADARERKLSKLLGDYPPKKIVR